MMEWRTLMKKTISLQISVVVGMLMMLLALAPTSAQAAPISFDLWAKTGTVNLPGSPNTPVWGFAATSAGSAQIPGPEIVVTAGDVVTVHLHNNLAETTAIWFQGQGTAPDLTGAAPGGTHDYTFTASKPGTYLYEAGLLPNAEHQVAMGLYGVLIVRPTTANQAYDDAASAFAGQATVVLGEIDPALNASPATFDMRNYAPKYYLINGKPYDPAAAAPSILVAAGTTHLLRFANAGVQPHSMTALGLRQQVLAIDGNRYTIDGVTPYSQMVAAQTIQPGQTSDVLVAIPATPNVHYALYDANLLLNNNNVSAANFGGMLTFLDAGTTAGSGKPTTSNTALAPSTTNGSVSVAVTAKVTTATALNSTRPAEYFIDTKGVDGNGEPMVTTPCPAGVDVCGTIPVSVLSGLPSGQHTVYVHAQNGAGWGAFDFAVLNLDKAGPATTGLVLSPNPTNGLVAVALSATGTDAATGGSTIAAAQYTIDGGCPAVLSPCSMTVSPTFPPGATIASLTKSIPQSYVTTLAPGTHAVAVRSTDALGNPGPWATINLTVDTNGPITDNVSATPNPSNGKIGVNANTAAVRVVARVSDAPASVPATLGPNAIIAAVEGFIDPVGTPMPGTGIVFVPQDGNFNTAVEWATVDIPLTTINALANGNHTISVRGKDSAGNWGPFATVTLVIDKTAPTLGSVTLTPSTIVFGTASVTLNVTASDGTGTGVSGGQYWIDGTATPPANATPFAGTSVPINTSTLATGSHTVYVRVKDAAGNWSAVSNATLTVILAVNDTRTISANTNATQTSDANAAAGVLTNDQPVGLAGRTAGLVSVPTRTSGTGAGTITLSCPASLGAAATPSVSGQTICTNGAYRATLNGVGGTGPARQASKRGTFTFTYNEIVNGVTSTATVTLTVN
jgi:hypothetical protein